AVVRAGVVGRRRAGARGRRRGVRDARTSSAHGRRAAGGPDRASREPRPRRGRGGAMRVVHRVEVRGRAGAGPATWGQTAIRRALAALEPLDHQFNLVSGGPLDRPVTADAALAVVRALVERHDSLRTLIRPDGDGYAQELCAAGTVEVVEERA